MAYNIVKHRRGTTQEWLEVNLVPEVGELVIEECANGTRKCKIGNGFSRFSDLPYIDEETQHILLTEIEKTKLIFDKKLSVVEDKLLEQSSNTEQVITDVKTELDSRLSEVTTDFGQRMTSVESQTTLNKQNIKNLVQCTEALTDELDSEVDLRKAQIEDLTNSLDSLDHQITELEASLSKTSKDITASYEAEVSKAKADLQTSFNTVTAKTNKEIKALKANVDQRLNDTNEEYFAALAALRDSVDEADKVLANAISGLSQQEKDFSASLNARLDSLSNRAYQLENSDANIKLKIAETKNILNQVSDKIDADISIIRQKQTEDLLVIANQIADLTKSQQAADIAIINSMIDYVTKIYAEIEDLVDDDITTLIRVYKFNLELTGQIEAVNQRITAEIGSLDGSVSDAIDALQQQIEKTLADFNTELGANFKETVEALEYDVLVNKEAINKNKKDIEDLTTDLQNTQKSLTETSSIINTNKAAAERAINAVSDQVRDTNVHLDSVDTRVASIDKRMSTFTNLAEGSTTGDAELMDIRAGYDGLAYDCAGDAVRAIGNDVKSLRNSLSQYIDTQAINGLRYDYSGEVGLMQPYMLYLTANGEVLQDSGVQIISGGSGGGGGGSSTSDLKINYITTSPVIVTTSDNAILKFNFSGVDSSGDTLLQASATWKVNGRTVEYGTVKDGENEFDVTKYLTVGTSKVLLIVTDDNGTVATKPWAVQQIELSIESSFNSMLTYEAEKEITFNYTPFGAVEKTAVFILDGKEIDRVDLSADISGRETRYVLPPQKHGSHLLEIYLEAMIEGKSEPIYSNHITKDILWYDSSNDLPVIGIQDSNLKIKQYGTANIVYTVYDPKSETPTVSIEIDDIEVSKTVLKTNPNYNNTPTSAYSYTETIVGTHTVKIICGKTEKILTVEVEALGINIAPITSGLAFDFNPSGRTNGDIDNRLWSYKNIKMTVSDNFDWTNGGYIPDDPDGPCFCIKAGSTATIDYKLFADNATSLGKEFKLIFKTKNVANPDAIFLSCLDNTTEQNHIGIKMGVHGANVYGQSGNLELAYSEEDTIEFEFNISKNTEKVPMVMGYEDGVPSRPMVYDDTYSFTQINPKEITLGSPDCDLYIYRFKVYNTSLTAAEILNNFIADARTSDEMISRYNRNQIYDENNKLTPDTLAEKCPWLRVYKVSAPHFTNNKSDKVIGTTIQQLYKNGDPVLDNWICYNAQHSGQGTSSNNYGAAGRNLDFIMNKSGVEGVKPHFELGDGTTAKTITLTRTSVPVAYLNAKVNIASSNNLTNAILANRYNEFNPYKRPFVARDDIDLAYIKDTMEFHNCVIFIQETDPDMTTHREFADNDWHFYAIGNIGDSKKTDNTRATDPDDKYECCVEILDVGLPLSDFPTDTMINAMGYSVDEKTGEHIYTWAKKENLGILYELIDGEYKKTEDTEIDLNKVYYVDILENDDFSKDYTYDWRYISDDEDTEVVDFCKQKWIDFYRFVTTSSDADFKAHLADYFVVDSALFYYLFTTRYCMVDNRAKNTFWHYSKTGGKYEEDINIYSTDGNNTLLFSAKAGDDIRKWDLCWDYDNDTSLGLNNYGKQVYRYGLEDTDRDAAGEEVFRESDSKFFCRIRDLFSPELKVMYNDLESKNAWHAESFLNKCDAWQEEFPEELWRLDIDRKYVRTYTSSFINGKGDSQFLVNMCNGRMKYHRRQWERNQEQYMASKYQTIRASSDEYHANFRVNRFDNTDTLVVPPNYQFTLTPFSYIYLNVWYGDTSRAPYSVRAVPNVPTPVPCPTALEADIINIGSASAIRDFGDLSASYPKTVSIGNASRVKKLTLGNNTEGYDNSAFTTLTTGANPLLEELNVENISSLTQALDLKKLTNLKKLYAYGTGIPSVLFAEGGKIDYVELPAINNISLKKLRFLSTDNLRLSNFNNVIDLIVEDCPLIDQVSLLNTCNNLLRARLIGIDFGTVDYEYFTENIFKLKGINSTGDGTTENAVLVGNVKFDYLTGSQFNELGNRYPQLTVAYNTLESIITFVDTDLETNLHQATVFNAADYTNPVFYEEVTDPADIPEGMIAKPTKESTAEFDYEFLGWSTTSNVIVSTEDPAIDLEATEIFYKEDTVKAVEGDRTLYPVFKSIRRNYPVTFVNATIKDEEKRVLAVINTPYGSDANYFAAGNITPTKEDAADSTFYNFSGWLPDSTYITGPRICYAQFAFNDDKWHELELSDITGYSLNNNTIAITGVNKITSNANKAIKVPSTFSLPEDDNATELTTFNLTSLGGFNGHSNLEMVKLPEPADYADKSYFLSALNSNAFLDCTSLFEITLPNKLRTIGSNALRGCSRLKEIKIPPSVDNIGNGALGQNTSLERIIVEEGNKRFHVVQNCLLDKQDEQNQKLIQGLGWRSTPQAGLDAGIPQDGSVKELGAFCFANMQINSATIPEGITNIPENAFSRCTKLSGVSLPESLTLLDATCFAWCTSLKEVYLPKNLKAIYTFVFDSCPLTNVMIPASVIELRERSFGSMPNTLTVTFENREEPPEIHRNAFQYSNTVIFRVPWTKEQHEAKFTGEYSNGSTIYSRDPFFGAGEGSVIQFIDEQGNIIEEMFK